MKTLNLLILLSLVFGLSAVAQKNLVENAGFEDDLSNWTNNGNGIKTTPWNVKAGKNSCLISAITTDQWIGIDQTISIPKKAQVIEVSAWLKAFNVVKGKDDWSSAVFIVEFLNSQDKHIGENTTVAHIIGDQEWERSDATIKVPDGAASFKIMFALSNASGVLQVDDVVARVLN